MYHFLLAVLNLFIFLTCIAYCLHFVDVVIVNNVIKAGVELVEEVHDLVGSAGTRQLSEAHNVTVAGTNTVLVSSSFTFQKTCM